MTAERDKFNVWVALMNLEDAYGGERAEDAVMAVFNRYGSHLQYFRAYVCAYVYTLRVCRQRPCMRAEAQAITVHLRY